MKSIIDDTLELKKIIENSNEYKEYNKLTKLLDKDKKINNLINEIKLIQQSLVKKKVKNEHIDIEEEKLELLIDQLNSIDIYKQYLQASKRLNEIITKVQNNFSNELNDIIN